MSGLGFMNSWVKWVRNKINALGHTYKHVSGPLIEQGRLGMLTLSGKQPRQE